MKRRVGKQIGCMLSIALLLQTFAPAGGPAMADEILPSDLPTDPAQAYIRDGQVTDETNPADEDEAALDPGEMILTEDVPTDGEVQTVPAEDEIVMAGDEIPENFDDLAWDEDVIFEEEAEDLFFEEEIEELVSEEETDAFLPEETEMLSEDPEDLFEDWEEETAREEAEEAGTGPAVTTWEALKDRLEDGTNDTISLGNDIFVTMKSPDASSFYRISMTSGSKTLELGEHRIVFLNPSVTKGGNPDFTGGGWIEVGGSAALTVNSSSSTGGIYARNFFSGADDLSKINATSAIRVNGNASLTVRNTTVGTDLYIGKGIEAADNANVVIDGATVIGAQHWAVFVQSGAVKLTIKNNALLKLFNNLKSKARMSPGRSGQGALYFLAGTGTLNVESGEFISGVQVYNRFLSCFSPAGHEVYAGGSYILTESEFHNICNAILSFGTFLPDPDNEQGTYKELSVQPKTTNFPIENIAVGGLTEPAAGQFKDTSAASMSDRYKTSGNVDWYRKTGSAEWTFSDPDEPFLQGEAYEARLTLKAEPGFVFPEGSALDGHITINGTLDAHLNVLGPKTIVIAYTFPEIPSTSQTSPVRFFAGDAEDTLCVVYGKQISNLPKGTIMTAPGQEVIPAEQIPANKEFDHWEMTAWAGTTYKTFSFYPNDAENPIVILDQSMDLKAVYKWKAGVPLVSEVHITVPKPRGGVLPTELPAGSMVITTVPANALKQDALAQLLSKTSSEWMESSDGSTFTGILASTPFTSGRLYMTGVINTLQTGLSAMLDLSVAKGMKDHVNWYINDVMYFNPGRFRTNCDPSQFSGVEITIPDQVWTGSPLTPEPSVSFKGRTLVKGTDYEIGAYTNNTQVGTATVKLTGKINFSGSKDASFRILPANPTGPQPASVINGDVTPEDPVYAEVMESTITGMKSDSDVTGATFSLLRVKATAKKTSVTLKWKKVPWATGYMIYGNKCGKKNRYQKLATVVGTSYTQKKLKKGTYYKYIVVAVKDTAAIAASKTIHVATSGGKVGNPVKVTAGSRAITLKRKKTKTAKIRVTVKAGPLTIRTHRAVAWESDNTSVAKVSKKGKITAVGKGTCYVYAYAQNGAAARIRVTVK